MENARIARRVTLTGLIANALLCVMKLAVGFAAHSSGLISDAVNSASDVLNTLIAMIGVRLGNKQADEDHPYGHARFECVASLLLADRHCPALLWDSLPRCSQSPALSHRSHPHQPGLRG